MTVVLPSGSPARGATIYDVARVAGVSHQTVSRLLRGFEGIRPETRERVERALQELNYRPNLTARSLATSRSHRIGALVYELLEVGPSKTIAGASQAAREAGYLLDIVSLDPSDDDEVSRALEVLARQDLAGVLAFAPVDLIADRIESAGFTVPVVLEAPADDAVATAGDVGVSDVGIDFVVDHLVQLGHRSMAHVSGPLDWWASRHRREAFERALDRHGLGPVAVAEGQWSAASGYSAVEGLPLDDVTAIVAANDQMALGVLRALAERGIRVPDRMSVAGFDDVPEAAFYHPPLTTVRVDYEQQGRRLVHRLRTELEGMAVPPPPFVEPVLLRRASTGPAPR